ncbi:NAD-dependent protein deacetylase [Thermocrinis minervae]|uniref:NAD-dependent protein deacylase n=1 Tax=Thermocrinis minervae TaxID=381751 RepID=A0A1M6SIQ8_9AQUI|nr:NAD-dependent protein deacetylase [Thermocrinis minervae]SHK44509.1 NAD-dependent deacetylase [Thermocrinis minervae]
MKEAAELLKKSKHAVVFTGAGISAESGVPTFRGFGGLWKNYKPEELATPEAFSRDPILVWQFYRWRQEIAYKANPNPGHLAIAKMESMGVVKAVITQNVDGLHQRAGNKHVIELHGSLWRLRCVGCGAVFQIEKPVDEVPPRCESCGSLLRPGVVWFGEPLPQREYSIAIELMEKSDVVLVVGTSGLVYPAAYLPQLAKEKGAKLIEVNVEESALTPLVDIFLKGPAGEVLPKLVEELP